VEVAGFLIGEVGLEGWESSSPDELSGGMRRRMELARCFSREPGAILLDEPFSGLQKEARTALWEKFLHLWEQTRCPVVIATHYPEELPAMDGMVYYSLDGSPAVMRRLG
jgi:NitT/TauT family transport system ATP-binding protein